MELDIKRASFGGYDKAATESYIESMQQDYEGQIAKLRQDAEKLSQAVKGLQQIREQNNDKAKSASDDLKSVNENPKAELDRVTEELASYKAKEEEAASRYESISRTLLAARESADTLSSETNAECKKLREETERYCDDLRNQTEAECQRLATETQNSCDEQKETTYAECENLKRQTQETVEQQLADAQTKCNEMLEETEQSVALAKAKNREEITQSRVLVKREFDTIKAFMVQLQASLSNVDDAVAETKKIVDDSFNDVNSNSTDSNAAYSAYDGSESSSSYENSDYSSSTSSDAE